MNEWYPVLFEIKEWMFFGASVLFIICAIVMILMKKKYSTAKKVLVGNDYTLQYFNPQKTKTFIYLGILAAFLTLLLPIAFPPFESYGVLYLVRQWFLPIWFIMGSLIWAVFASNLLLRMRQNFPESEKN